MVKIPEKTDPTLDAMIKAVEQNHKNQNRDYLGASLIGDPCARKIWYQYNGYEGLPSSAIGIMAADSGRYAESKTAERLRMVEGIELYTHMENGEQYGWSRFGGKLQGHFDGLIRGLIQAPNAIHIWEHKDKDQSKFVNFQTTKKKFGEKDTLINWDEGYYGQAQLNMHFARLDGIPVNRHYLTVSYAGARKYDSCRTEYNEPYALRLVDKAEKLLEVTTPPPKINEKPDFFLCRFCNFREICHGV